MKLSEYLNFKQSLKYMGLNERNYAALKSMIANGLPVVVIGNSRRISKAAIDEFMKEHTVTVKHN